MFSSPFAPLIKYGLILLAVSAFIGGIYLSGRSAGVKAMQSKVETAQSETALWKQTADNRATMIEAQNKAVDELKSAADRRITELNKKLAMAVSEDQKAQKDIKERETYLYKLELPKNECEALYTLVDTYRLH